MVQALEKLQKITENGARDNAYISLHKLKILRLKQAEKKPLNNQALKTFLITDTYLLFIIV